MPLTQIDANYAMARATALVEAVKVLSGRENQNSIREVMLAAQDFFEFLTQDSVALPSDSAILARPAGAVAAPAPAPVAKPVAAAKPAKAKPAPAPKPVEEPEVDEAPATDTTKEQVGEIISKLLSAKLREEAIGLLKDFKATSVSGVKPADYEKFVAAGKVLLGQAALAAQGEVEADIED